MKILTGTFDFIKVIILISFTLILTLVKSIYLAIIYTPIYYMSKWASNKYPEQIGFWAFLRTAFNIPLDGMGWVMRKVQLFAPQIRE